MSGFAFGFYDSALMGTRESATGDSGQECRRPNNTSNRRRGWGRTREGEGDFVSTATHWPGPLSPLGISPVRRTSPRYTWTLERNEFSASEYQGSVSNIPSTYSNCLPSTVYTSGGHRQMQPKVLLHLSETK